MNAVKVIVIKDEERIPALHLYSGISDNDTFSYFIGSDGGVILNVTQYEIISGTPIIKI